MRTIWKFPLKFSAHRAVVQVPRDAELLHFEFLHRGPMGNGPRPGVPTVWFLVDPAAPNNPVTFEIYGTGHPIPDDAQHVATWDAEPFIWHLFRRFDPSPPGMPEGLPLEAANAYRLLYRDGFRVVRGGADLPVNTWRAPNAEPLNHEQILAVAVLREHGFGGVLEQ